MKLNCLYSKQSTCLRHNYISFILTLILSLVLYLIFLFRFNMNNGVIMSISRIDLANPRVKFQTFSSSVPIYIYIYDVDAQLVQTYLKLEYKHCIAKINSFKAEAHEWRIIHSYLNSGIPLNVAKVKGKEFTNLR